MGNNPIKYVDPDGRIIIIDENAGQAFVQDVEKGLEYLRQSKLGKDIIDALEKSDTIYTIKKCSWMNSSDKDFLM